MALPGFIASDLDRELGRTIAVLKATIWRLHDCGVVHSDTVHVFEAFKGKTVWDGDVEVFDLFQHPKAKRAYAWVQIEGPNDEQTRVVVVLELPPVIDAKTAVRASKKFDFEKRATWPFIPKLKRAINFFFS
jgi:hypothetical protein